MVGKLRNDYETWGMCNYKNESKDTIPTAGLSRSFTILRQGNQYPWLLEYSSAIVKAPLRQIETTYDAFFKDLKTGRKLGRSLPKFHGKYTTAPSFPINYQTAKVAGDSLRLQKVGWMKLVGNNPYPEGEFTSGRVKYDAGIGMPISLMRWKHKPAFRIPSGKWALTATSAMADGRCCRTVRNILAPTLRSRLPAGGDTSAGWHGRSKGATGARSPR